MNHAQFTHLLTGIGIEIGAHTSPVPGIHPIYVDKFPEFAGTSCLMDCFGTLESLPVLDASLDYVVASHVLEHSANPIRALVEIHRVLRSGGIAYLVLPDKNLTWDRRRESTPVDHFFEDFERGTTDCDGTHIDDFVYNVVWDEFSPHVPADKADESRAILAGQYKEAVAQGLEINIHFHTFDPDNLRAMIEKVNRHPIPASFEILHCHTKFPESTPNGILVILKKTTRSPMSIACKRRWGRWFSGRYPFTRDAKRVERPVVPGTQVNPN